MVLFFDLEKLELQASNNYDKFISLLRYHYDKRLPTRNLKYRPSTIPLVGRSFLLNPEPLFKDSVDIVYKVQYVKLAARRDYYLYKKYGYKGLLLSYYPDLNYDAIKLNPLLQITQTDIFFKYEEIKNGTKL